MRVCVRTLKGKRLELSTPNLVHVYPMAVARQALTGVQKVKGQGHTVTKILTVAWLVANGCCGRYATAAGVGLHVV